MFEEVDESLLTLLKSDVPLSGDEIEVSFERPNREWSSRLTRPMINLFLYDVREREELKDDLPLITRDENGRSVKQRPPRRMDLAYLVSVWARDVRDEHHILGRIAACLLRNHAIPENDLQGGLKDSHYPTLARVTRPDELVRLNDLWAALGNDLHASLNWIITAPLDVFAPVSGPLVRTREIGFGASGESWRESIVQVAGLARRNGEPQAGIRVEVAGTGLASVTNPSGIFSFPNMPAGEYTWRIINLEGKVSEEKVIVPSPTYDLEL